MGYQMYVDDIHRQLERVINSFNRLEMKIEDDENKLEDENKKLKERIKELEGDNERDET